MIDKLAGRIAIAVKRANSEQTASVEVLQYALIIYINTSLIFIQCLLIGWLTNKLTETLLCFLVFTVLRFFSGGKHASSTMACNLLSTLVLASIPHLAVQDTKWVLLETIASLLIMAMFAPNIDSETDIDARYYPVLKAVSLCIVVSNLFFQSGYIGLCLLAQSVTIIPWWERRTRV